MYKSITIGTRSSKLALWQAKHVKEELLKHFPDLEIELKEIKTKGDHITDVALSKVGGKGLFTKEIEDALLKGGIDLAVHSLKDLPTKLPEGLKIGAVLTRENPCDVLISKNKVKFKKLTSGAKIGTSSLRRIAQLKAIRADLEYMDLRGNLDTRIKKLESGEYDGIILAYAGVKRLGFENLISEHFSTTEIFPAVGQGTLVVEIRENDLEIEGIIFSLNNYESHISALCERSFLERLQGGCQVPIGAISEIKNDEIIIKGIVTSLDGKRIIKGENNGKIENSRQIGIQLAEKLLQNGGNKILMEILETSTH